MISVVKESLINFEPSPLNTESDSCPPTIILPTKIFS